MSLWYRAWTEVSTLQRNSFEYFDPTNGNILTITVNTTQPSKPDEPIKIEMEMDIAPAETNETFIASADVSKRKAAK